MPEQQQVRPGEYADLMPDMSDEEFEALKRSIKQNGFDETTPIVVDGSGTIVDGHHRFKACRELDVKPEIVTVEGATIEQAYRSNLARRNLQSGTKRKLVKQYLSEHFGGERTQQEVAEALGVGQATVSRAWQDIQPDNLSRDEKRKRALEYVAEHPDASNREVAEAVDFDVSYESVRLWRADMEAEAEMQALAGAEPVTPGNDPVADGDGNDTADEPAGDADPEPEPDDEPAADDPEPDDLEPEEPPAADEPGPELSEEPTGSGDVFDGDGAPERPAELEPDDRVAELKAVIGDLNGTVGDLNRQLDEVRAENERLRERIGRDDPEGASAQVLRRMVNERNAALRELIEAVRQEDAEAVRAVAEQAQALVHVEA